MQFKGSGAPLVRSICENLAHAGVKCTPDQLAQALLACPFQGKTFRVSRRILEWTVSSAQHYDLLARVVREVSLEHPGWSYSVIYERYRSAAIGAGFDPYSFGYFQRLAFTQNPHREVPNVTLSA